MGCGSSKILVQIEGNPYRALERAELIQTLIAGHALDSTQIGFLEKLARSFLAKLYSLKPCLTPSLFRHILILLSELQLKVEEDDSAAVSFKSYLARMKQEYLVIILEFWRNADSEEFSKKGLAALQFDQEILENLLVLQRDNISYYNMAIKVFAMTGNKHYLNSLLLKYLCEVSETEAIRKITLLADLDFIQRDINTRTGKAWVLKPKTLAFFAELRIQENVPLHEASAAAFAAGAGAVVSKSHYDNLVDKIVELAGNGLFFNAAHIDDMAAALIMQRERAAFLNLKTIDDILTAKVITKESLVTVIGDISHRGHAELAEITVRNQIQSPDKLKKLLLHHSLPHSAEVMIRSLSMMDRLLPGYMSDVLLRALAGFLAEFHDLEQQLGDAAETNEQLTVKFIMAKFSERRRGLEFTLLSKGVSLSDIKKIIDIIEFIAHRMIVVGTTMVFGDRYNTDGAELFLAAEEVLVEVPTLQLSEIRANLFVQAVNVMMLIIGVCDKSPVACFEVMAKQYQDPLASTLPLVRKTMSVPMAPERFELPGAIAAAAAASGAGRVALSLPFSLVLDEFFNDSRFTSYYRGEYALGIDQQAFLATIVANFSMSMELAVIFARGTPAEILSKKTKAQTLVEFIVDQRVRLTPETDSTPRFSLEEFIREMEEKDIYAIVKELFFDSIAGEIAFTHKQCVGIERAKNNLRSVLRKTIKEVTMGESVATAAVVVVGAGITMSGGLPVDFDNEITSAALEAHAKNLEYLRDFYQSLVSDQAKQKNLVNELLLTILHQAGHHYVHNKTVPYLMSISGSTDMSGSTRGRAAGRTSVYNMQTLRELRRCTLTDRQERPGVEGLSGPTIKRAWTVEGLSQERESSPVRTPRPRLAGMT
ncbi:MAG: hypothetical protein A3E87_08435 [Gammaproteobacteria bacterium RIFCSPHIGHO2_12_FULL_35_23]|nr:MAG: hypothetical protein A3E87_08435 [Gammaproteobacteria bacterium RIFCSPHIGHO2_12_FULL_35_23]